MKTITKEYTVYEFKELSDDVKNKVIEEWYEKEDYPFLEEYLLDQLSMLDTKKAFSNVKLSYSLSCCQGDGLSFKADIDVSKFTKSKKVKSYIVKAYSTGNKGHYTFASESDIIVDTQDINDDGVKITNSVELIIRTLEKSVQSYYLDICRQLENFGYSILEYRMTHDEFQEHCEANEYNFLVDGTMVNY